MDINLLSLYEQIDIQASIINEIDDQIDKLEETDPKRAHLLAHRSEKYKKYLELKDELQRYLCE